MSSSIGQHRAQKTDHDDDGSKQLQLQLQLLSPIRSILFLCSVFYGFYESATTKLPNAPLALRQR